MKKGTSGQASVHVDAPTEQVYDVVTDVRRMGEWSPETYKTEWLDGATGPALGARFKGSNRRGIARWSTKPRVTACERPREFSFVTDLLGKDQTKWTYRFEPDGDGTRVTESFELLSDTPAVIRFMDRYVMRIEDRKADLEQAMQQTLDRIKRAVEAGAGR